MTDFLRNRNFLYVAEKTKNLPLSKRNKDLLLSLLNSGKEDVECKLNLIENDMGMGALSLIDSLDERVFKSPNIFFGIVLDLWKNLRLI